jgi:large subunit ribosomal protein L9
MRQRAHKEEKIRKEAEILAQAIEAVELKIGAKVGQSGKIFGSVNAMQISDALKSQHNLIVDRKKIDVKGESIKETGSYSAVVNLHREVKATVKFEVVAE